METTRQKEPWDLERFIMLYNQEVDQNGHWYYERSDEHDRNVRSDYLSSSTLTLAEHAFERVRYEQRT